jgi:hypothetical protein
MLYNVLLNLNKVNWYNDTPFEGGTDDAAFAVLHKAPLVNTRVQPNSGIISIQSPRSRTCASLT